MPAFPFKKRLSMISGDSQLSGDRGGGDRAPPAQGKGTRSRKAADIPTSEGLGGSREASVCPGELGNKRRGTPPNGREVPAVCPEEREAFEGGFL